MFITFVIAALALAAPAAAASSPRSYAHSLVIARWHSEVQWQALDAVVTPESGWNPCAVFPGHTDCSYRGTNSCGIPQANPCPYVWTRVGLGVTWRAQVRWLIAYVARRYGSPLGALAFRRWHGWY